MHGRVKQVLTKQLQGVAPQHGSLSGLQLCKAVDIPLLQQPCRCRNSTSRHGLATHTMGEHDGVADCEQMAATCGKRHVQEAHLETLSPSDVI